MGGVPTDESSDIKVKSIFCFTVAPEMKRKGIAARLLQRVCLDAALDGFDLVEAYPNKEPGELDFEGHAKMYGNNGFIVHHETERKYIMRKMLK